uniref:Uncharacterized protein n=1 Tax=Globodera rostochiensis TaxID=31243 RepID=A0A914HW09_GLORO
MVNARRFRLLMDDEDDDVVGLSLMDGAVFTIFAFSSAATSSRSKHSQQTTFAPYPSSPSIEIEHGGIA